MPAAEPRKPRQVKRVKKDTGHNHGPAPVGSHAATCEACAAQGGSRLHPGESLEVGASVQWNGPRGSQAWITSKVTVVVQEDESGMAARLRAREIVDEELAHQATRLREAAQR